MSYKYAVLFPGQGSQYESMSKDIIESSYSVNKYFKELHILIGEEKAKKVIEAKKDSISKTSIAQLAVFLNSISLYEIFKEKYCNIKIDAAAGLSLGEYSAHYTSGTIDFEKAIKLIDKRGDIMSKYASGMGTMVAVLKSSEDEIEKIIESVTKDREGILSICNLNCPGQIVVGGTFDLIDEFKKLCKFKGIKKMVDLDIEGPFHTEILKEASEEFYEYLSDTTFNDFKLDMYTNLSGLKYEDINSIPDILRKQMYSQVKFETMIKNMISDGYNRFIEIGPGNVLKGFIKKIDKNVEVFNIQSIEDIQSGGVDEL